MKTSNSKRRRWIRIGTVQQKYLHWLNWGVPDGLEIVWVGRWDPFQPFEFLYWSSLLAAVSHRLKMAGLRRVSVATEVQTYLGLSGTRALLVEVERLGWKWRPNPSPMRASGLQDLGFEE